MYNVQKQAADYSICMQVLISWLDVVMVIVIFMNEFSYFWIKPADRLDCRVKDCPIN